MNLSATKESGRVSDLDKISITLAEPYEASREIGTSRFDLNFIPLCAN